MNPTLRGHPRTPGHGREQLATPCWVGDQLDSDLPSDVQAPYFDRVLDSWILSRHADVLAALRAPTLSLTGPHQKKRPDPHDESVGLKLREETIEALSSAQLRSWRERLAPQAYALAGTLSPDRPVDVVGEYARPLCLILAAMVTGIELHEARSLEEKAQLVSASAAEPYDANLRAHAKLVSAGLAAHFHSGPELLRSSGFVALSQTLQRLLGSAWFVLLRQPREWRQIHLRPELTEQAMEELLRCAGLPRILFRTATADTDINGSLVRSGERVILRIIAANHDPARYCNSNQFELTRRGAGHLTLGAGLHACTGAGLIRMGAVAITQPLLQRFSAAQLAQPVEWHGGSGFRSPLSLWVRLSVG